MIFSIPHASTVIPSDTRSTFLINDQELSAELLAMTDHYTDKLFGSCCADFERKIVAKVSRLVVDVERFPDDADEPMASRGMGVVYTNTSRLEKYRNILSPNGRKKLLDTHYYTYHAQLEHAVCAELKDMNNALILDCHSFPSVALQYEDEQGTERPDFCLGTDGFHTPQEFVEFVQSYLQSNGYSVSINSPFSGSIVPIKFYKKDINVISLMIEVNRSLYMDENTGEKSKGYRKIQRLLKGLVELVRAYQESDYNLPELAMEFGDIIASQDWNSGGPGAGAGTVSLYEFYGSYYTFHDAGFDVYDSLEVAVEKSGVFVTTSATECVWIDPKIKRLVGEITL